MKNTAIAAAALTAGAALPREWSSRVKLGPVLSGAGVGYRF